jgi:hypothetical protein
MAIHLSPLQAQAVVLLKQRMKSRQFAIVKSKKESNPEIIQCFI